MATGICYNNLLSIFQKIIERLQYLAFYYSFHVSSYKSAFDALSVGRLVVDSSPKMVKGSKFMPHLVYLVEVVTNELVNKFYVIEICDTDEWAQKRARYYRHAFLGAEVRIEERMVTNPLTNQIPASEIPY